MTVDVARAETDGLTTEYEGRMTQQQATARFGVWPATGGTEAAH